MNERPLRATPHGMNQRPGQTILEVLIAIGIIIASVGATTTLIISTITVGRASQSNVEAMNIAREGVEIIQAYRDTNWLRRDQNIGDDPQGAAAPTVVAWDDGAPLHIDRDRLKDGYAPMGSESSNECNPGADQSVMERYRAIFGSPWILLEEFQGNRCNNTIPNNLDIFLVHEITVGGLHFAYTQEAISGITQPTKYRRIINVTKGYETLVGSTYQADTVEPIECPANTACVEYLDVVSEVFWRERSGSDSKYRQGNLIFNRRVTIQKRLYNWR